MSTNQTATSTRARAIHAAAAAGHLIIALALGAVAVAQESILLPIALSVPAVDAIGVFGYVNVAAAAVVVLLISTASHTAIATSLSSETRAHRARLLQLIAFSQVSAITVFLVAQVNGVAEAGALVLVYAISAGAVGLLWLQSPEVDRSARARGPFSVGAALAVVPWGIVALYQIAALTAGSPPSPLVRVFTVVILLLVAVAWWVERGVLLGTLSRGRSALVHASVSLANGIALLVLAVGLDRPSTVL